MFRILDLKMADASRKVGDGEQQVTELRNPELTVASPAGLCFAAKSNQVSCGSVSVMSITAGVNYQQPLG